VPGQPRLRRRLGRVQQIQRFGSSLLLQQAGGEIDPRLGVAGVAVVRFAQQRLGRWRVAGQAQERAQVGGGGAVAGRGGQRAPHRLDGALDVAQTVARQAEIEPRVGELRSEVQGRPKRLFRAVGLPSGQPGATEDVMRLRQMGRTQFCFARGGQGVPVMAQSQQRRGEVQRRRGVVRQQRLAVPEDSGGLRVASGGVQAETVMQPGERIVRGEAARALQQREATGWVVQLQAAQAQKPDGRGVSGHLAGERAQDRGGVRVRPRLIAGLRLGDGGLGRGTGWGERHRDGVASWMGFRDASVSKPGTFAQRFSQASGGCALAPEATTPVLMPGFGLVPKDTTGWEAVLTSAPLDYRIPLDRSYNPMPELT
jgi:hypothetical protein